MNDFKPSEVNLSMGFVDTFNHAEAENTALVMVKVAAMNGDTWRTFTCEELASGFTAMTKDPGPWRDYFNNPFRRIDMHDLVKRGFAEWEGDKAIAFTETGLERMRKWVAAPQETK